MKKLTLIIAVMLIGITLRAQTDLAIAEAIIGRPFVEIEERLNDIGVEYYITSESNFTATLYIYKENSVRLWDINRSNLYRTRKVDGVDITVLAGEDLINEIFVRYRHSNLNDLKEFYEYELPKNTEFREYEKSLGAKL